jgi:hypothetical protein
VKQSTPPEIRELRRRAIAAGIPWDELSPLLRENDIVRPTKGATTGLLPISRRTWRYWVEKGFVPAPIRFDNGVSAWHLATVVRIALDGLPVRPRKRFVHKTKADEINA